jgi:L-lactate dehydrogenase (cytochrome)
VPKATQALNIAELRAIARLRLPRGIFDYVDRGAEDETGIAALRETFDTIRFSPRVLTDVSQRSLETTLLGRRQALPLAIAPTAAAGLVWHDGEIALARAAGTAGIPFCIATGSITALERIAAESSGPLWFQLYMWHEKALSYALMERAAKAGIETLVLTVDTVALPNREYNTRNGFEIPIRASLRGGWDMALHPHWVWRVLMRYILRDGVPTYQHYPEGFRSKITRKATWEQVRLNDAITWEDLRELRRRWRGKLILKGILRPDDAIKAAQAGVDAIVVSNHGARNLDAAAVPAQVLPPIADAIRGKVQILADSGVRRGSDVLKLLALGADAVLIGRAALYGTAAGGEAGAAHALTLLRNEIDSTLAFLGCARLSEVDRSLLSLPASWTPCHDPKMPAGTAQL